jgi:phosphatidylinositol 3-kinase
MDKDNRDDFTFAKLTDLKVPVTLRMSATFPGFHCITMYSRVDSSQFEGTRVPRTFTELLEKPELRFHGVQTSYVLEGSSFIISILMSEKRILRPLCHLPAAR